MAKILKNTTGQTVAVTDTGAVVPANGQYTIPPQDNLLWAASSDVVIKVGDGTLIVNDGSSDLSISDGIDLIKGIFTKKIAGGTDGTTVGNIGDRLKVDAAISTPVFSTDLHSNIIRSGEFAPTRTETDIPGTTYTVPSGKTFYLTEFIGSFDAQPTLYLRLKKQTGGTGSFATVLKMNLEVSGQGQSAVPYNFQKGLEIGYAGDVFKITVEASVAKGIAWSFFAGIEI
jgi:hypothetical protein